MERISLYQFYALAGILGRIPVLNPSRVVDRDVVAFFGMAALQLQMFEREWVKPYKICALEAAALRGAILKLSPTATHEVNAKQLRRIQDLFGEFQSELEHELPKLAAFAVHKVRGYDTEALITNAEKCLSDEAAAQLSEHLVDNWREAGRCLAFRAPTAAAYHMLRVTEAKIRKYHQVVTGKQASEPMDLAACIKGLRSAGAKSDVVAALVQLKSVHRNKYMHPGPTVIMDKAVSLFGLCISVIDEIAYAIAARNAGGSPP